MIKIEKNIPIHTAARYPWREMKVGDSFAVPIGDGEGPQVASGRRATGFRFTKTRVVEGKPPREMWRVWRVE